MTRLAYIEPRHKIANCLDTNSPFSGDGVLRHGTHSFRRFTFAALWPNSDNTKIRIHRILYQRLRLNMLRLQYPTGPKLGCCKTDCQVSQASDRGSADAKAITKGPRTASSWRILMLPKLERSRVRSELGQWLWLRLSDCATVNHE